MIDNKDKEKEYKFKGRVVKCLFDSEDFRIYALDVSSEYEKIKHNKYGNVTIQGELPELSYGIEYEICATEQMSKYGIGYKVVNIKREQPSTQEDMYLFLSEILTANQTKVLWEYYPDIVQRVKENRLDDIDLNKLKGIKEYTFEVIKRKIVENFCLADLIIEFQGYLSLSILKKIYNKYTSIDVLKTKLKQNPYKCICGLAGVGFKTADSILLEIERISNDNKSKGKEPIIEFEEELKSSPQRCLACLIYLLEENENEGHTKMNIADLRSQLLKLVPACADYFVEMMKNKAIYYNKDDMDVSLSKTYNQEHYIAQRILANLHNDNNVWDYDIEKYRTVDGFDLSDEQMNAVNNLCKYTISILNGSGGCVDCDTEYFNGTEWKPISEYKKGDRVLQYNKDGSAELVYPEEYHKKECEQMWHFETKYGLDQCLSEEHRVVYKTSRGNLNIKPFSEVMDIHNKNGFSGKFYTSFNYCGDGIDLTDNEIRLMIATFADGSFYTKEDGDLSNRARFSLKKSRKLDRLIYLAQITNCNFRITNSVAEEFYSIYVDVPFRSKHFPKEWYNCNKHQLEIIADEVMYWDGRYSNHNEYYTTNKSDADFVQFVYSSLNYRATIQIDDRKGEKHKTNGKTYVRKSIDYIVQYTKRNTVGLNIDKRTPDKKTKIKPYKTKDGYKYCFTMPSSMWVARRNNKIFITGNTGKTASTQAIINMLKDKNKSFCLFSPTGKAAKVLAEYTSENASTIHRGLGYNPAGYKYETENSIEGIEYKDSRIEKRIEITNWCFNKHNKLKTDVVVIDEFSMVDISLFERVLDAIDFKYTKLLLIGDNAQLPSVSYGNLLHDFMESNLIPTTTLTKVFRYGEGGLMKVATDVRFCQTYLDKSMKNKMTAFGGNQDYVFVDLASDVIPQNVVGLYKKLMEQGYGIEDIQVLTAKNVGDCGTIVLNNLIQKVANPNYGSKVNMSIGKGDNAITYYEGDMIIQKQNNYKAPMVDSNGYEIYNEFTDEAETAFIANGENGIIKEIFNSYMIIDFDGIRVKYYKNDMNMVGLGYSITIHKSQGSSIKVVILCTPQSHIFMLNSNLIYVGLTRMKEKCYHLGTLDSVNMAVKKKANLTRHTFMQQMLSTMTPEEYGLSDVEIANQKESVTNTTKSKQDTEQNVENIESF